MTPINEIFLRKLYISYYQSDLILPFNIAVIENNMLPVVNKTIPMMAVPTITNNIFVSSLVTYRQDEK